MGETEEPTVGYKNVWHTEEHEYHYFEPITCNSCGKTYTDSSEFEPLYYDSYIWTCMSSYKFVEARCPSCGSTDGNFRNELYEICCFVDGVCCDCGALCPHCLRFGSPDMGQVGYGTVLGCLEKVAPNHPLLFSDVTYENGDSFIVNGTCMLCLCSDYDDEVGLVYMNSDGFLLRTNDGSKSFYIVGYSGIGGDITLPSEFNGVAVVGIVAEAFSQSGINTVTIPSCITYIDDTAFLNCASLTRITFERQLTDNELAVAPFGASDNVEILTPELNALISALKTQATFTCTCWWDNNGYMVHGYGWSVPEDLERLGYDVGTYESNTKIYKYAYNIKHNSCQTGCSDYILLSVEEK